MCSFLDWEFEMFSLFEGEEGILVTVFEVLCSVTFDVETFCKRSRHTVIN